MKLRTPWQRLALSLLGILIVAANWRWAVFHLYTLPPTSISAFTSITNNAAYAIVAIVIFMVTGKLIYDWRNRGQNLLDAVSSATVAGIGDAGPSSPASPYNGTTGKDPGDFDNSGS